MIWRPSEFILKQTVRHNCVLVSVGLSNQVMVEYHMLTTRNHLMFPPPPLTQTARHTQSLNDTLRNLLKSPVSLWIKEAVDFSSPFVGNLPNNKIYQQNWHINYFESGMCVAKLFWLKVYCVVNSKRFSTSVLNCYFAVTQSRKKDAYFSGFKLRNKLIKRGKLSRRFVLLQGTLCMEKFYVP